MDFEFTSRPSAKMKAAWVEDDHSTPKKRTHDDLNPPAPAFPAPPSPIFGLNQNNTPFLFHTPPPKTHHVPDWVPPPNFSPSKAFPILPEPNDVHMADVSPPKPSETKSGEGQRLVALGAMRRVFKSRQRARGSKLVQNHDAPPSASESGEDDDDEVAPMTHSMSNHYTLNMPAPAIPQSETPYVLLGYLQFFFNLCLISVFLYLLVQFILTVQRDVEQRISEYSMDMVQEIALCAMQYKNNLCATNPIPAMAQQCGSWEICMQRDPTVIGRAKVGAELIAEVVNGFVEPISWKTLAFTLASLSFFTLFINALLSLYRAKHQPSHTTPVHPPYPVIPATPFPSQHFGGYLSPAPTPSWGRTWTPSHQEPKTPTRRRRLEGGVAAKIQ